MEFLVGLIALIVVVVIICNMGSSSPKDVPEPTFAQENLERAAKGGLCSDKGGVFMGYASQDSHNHGRPLFYDGDRHIITIGPTGSGKGSTALVQGTAGYTGSMLIVDVKGQLAAITARPRQVAYDTEIYAINPFGVLGLPTATYNPLRFIDPESPTFGSDCKRLAEGIVDIRKADHWEISALDVVAIIIMWVVLYAEEKNLITVREILGMPNKERMAFFDDLAACDRPEISSGAARYASDSNEVRDSIQTAVVQSSFLRDRAIENVLRGGGEREISFADLKKKNMTVYLIIPPDLLHTHGRFLRLLVMSALGELIRETSRPEKPVLFLLDEFAALGPMPSVTTAIALLREYRVKMWLVLQSIPQLKHLYGNNWETFLSSAGVMQFFTPNDLETADYISRRSGTHTEMRRSTSYSEGSSSNKDSTGTSTTSTESYSEQIVPNLTVQQVLDRSGYMAMLFCPNISDMISGVRLSYFDDLLWNGRWEPDPYHMKNDTFNGYVASNKRGEGVFSKVKFTEKDRAIVAEWGRDINERLKDDRNEINMTLEYIDLLRWLKAGERQKPPKKPEGTNTEAAKPVKADKLAHMILNRAYATMDTSSLKVQKAEEKAEEPKVAQVPVKTAIQSTQQAVVQAPTKAAVQPTQQAVIASQPAQQKPMNIPSSMRQTVYPCPKCRNKMFWLSELNRGFGLICQNCSHEITDSKIVQMDKDAHKGGR